MVVLWRSERFGICFDWQWSSAPVVQDIVITVSRDIPRHLINLHHHTISYDKIINLHHHLRILGLHFLDQSVQSDDIRVLHPQDDSGVSYKLLRNPEKVFFFFKGSNINSRCLDVHCQCSNRYSLALIPNVQMFRCWIPNVQMFSLPAAWPPATSSRVWLWRGENSLQVIIVDIVVNIIVVIIYLSSLLSFYKC